MCDAGWDAGPLSSIVWKNFLASGWFVHCYFLFCSFFLLAHCFFFFLSLYSYCYPNELLPFFLFLFPTCPLLLSFLLLFFHTWNCYFISCLFFPTCPLLLSLLLLFSCYFFPTWNCRFLSCYLLSCYFIPMHRLAYCLFINGPAIIIDSVNSFKPGTWKCISPLWY